MISQKEAQAGWAGCDEEGRRWQHSKPENANLTAKGTARRASQDQSESGGHPDLLPGSRKEAALLRIHVAEIYRCHEEGIAIVGTGSD